MTASVSDLGARRRWMAVLAKAESDELEAAWAGLGAAPAYRIVRGPEVGLVMVRGRAGGTGARFNLGEMTVTRCTVELDTGSVGHAYVRGRRPLVEALVVDRLAGEQAERRHTAEARAAATRVEFLTLVRGED